MATPISQNLYLYVEGDPVNNADPSGHAIADPDVGTRKPATSRLKKAPRPVEPPKLKKANPYETGGTGGGGRGSGNGTAASDLLEHYPPTTNEIKRMMAQEIADRGGNSGSSGSTSNPFEDYAPTTNEAKRIISQEIVDRANASNEGQMTLLDESLQLTLKNTTVLNRQFCSGNLKKASVGAGRVPTSEGELRAIAQQAFLLSLDAGTVQEWMSFSEFLFIIITAIITFIAPYIIPILLIAAGIISIIYGIYLAWQDAQTSAAEGQVAEGEAATDVPAPRANNRTVAGRSGDLPLTSDPDSSLDLRDEETGELLQRRFYGPDGRAQFDIDFKHGGLPGNHEFPHRHDWDWSTDPPIRFP